jgi:GTPase SAR1 family protein
MSKLYFPTGLSVEQVKKDAKKLSKKSKIKLNKCQDILSGIHARMPWSKAINLIDNIKDASFTLHNNKDEEINLTLNSKKSLTFIFGKPGCGKSTLLNTIIDQLLQDHKVTYLTVDRGIPPKIKKHFNKKYGKKINIIYYHYDFIEKDISINLDDIELNGSILVIDEFARMNMAFSKGNDFLKIKRLVDASHHTIISTQIIDETNIIQDVFSSFNERCVRLINSPYTTRNFFNLRGFPYFKGRYEEIMKDQEDLTLNKNHINFTITDSASTNKVRLLIKNAII